MSATQPLAHRFEVTSAFQAAGRSYVVARQLEVGSFTLTERAELGGFPIESWLDQPRTGGAVHGKTEGNFAFCLRSSEDLPRFKVGDVVELLE